MKIKSIRLNNFLVHKSTVLEFSDGINIITGENGSGKSSIVQAVYYSLFGETLYYSRSSEFLRFGERDFLVELETTDLTIRRTMKTFSTNLHGYDSPTKLKEYLLRKYNITPRRYENTLLVKQRSIDSFILMTPRERFKRFEKIVGVDVIKKIRDESKKIADEFKRQMQIFNYEELIRKTEELMRRKKEIEDRSEEIKVQSALINNHIQSLKEKRGRVEYLIKCMQEIENISKKEDDLRILDKFIQDNQEIYDKYKEFEKLYELAIKVKNSKENIDILIKRLEEIEKYKEGYEKYETFLKFSENPEIKSLELSYRRGIELKQKLEKVFETTNGLKEKIENAKNKKLESEKLKEEYISEIGKIDSEIVQSQKILSELKNVGNLCPICKREINEHTKDELIFEAKNKVKELESKKLKVLQLLEEVKKNLTEVESLLKYESEVNEYLMLKSQFPLERWKEWSRIKSFATKENKEAYSEYMKRSEVEKQLKENEEIFKSWNYPFSYHEVIDFIQKNKQIYIKYNEVLGQIKSLKDEISRKDKLIKEVEEYKKEIDIEPYEYLRKVEDEINELHRKLGELSSEDVSNRQRLEEISKNYEELQRQIDDYKKLKEKRTFYEDISEKLTELINYERKRYYKNLKFLVQHYFEKFLLSDYKDIEVDFIDDELMLYLINHSGNKIEANRLSGGERTALSLSLRLAIAQMLDIKFKLFILDEPTDGMDDIRIDSLKELFSNFILYNPDYQLIVITHEDDFVDVGNRIHLERRNGTAIVR
ncbi:MAG: AAA family ATPase [candidate division WOR-3 bacterium]|nr:AAA family ATPase [candidate division WOR-3 bacterium]